MSKKLTDICAGRDPIVFANNIRRHRQELGWSLRRLSAEANVSLSTLLGVEQGKGCSLPIEQKLASALRTVEGSFWLSPENCYPALHTPESDRWSFADHKEWVQYMRRHGLVFDDEVPRCDPDPIQDEFERHRIGRAGMATWFIRRTTSQLPSATVRSSVLELFGTREEGANLEGLLIYKYCLRGSVHIRNGQNIYELYQGDTLTFEMNPPMVIGPSKPVAEKELPPLLISVLVDPLRIIARPEWIGP